MCIFACFWTSVCFSHCSCNTHRRKWVVSHKSSQSPIPYPSDSDAMPVTVQAIVISVRVMQYLRQYEVIGAFYLTNISRHTCRREPCYSATKGTEPCNRVFIDQVANTSCCSGYRCLACMEALEQKRLLP